MPVISKFGSRSDQRIDTRVQSGRIDARVGNTDKAISNIGGAAFEMANAQLKLQKDDQAENYKNDKIEEKDVLRSEYTKDAMSKMDPATGLMPNGVSYLDHMKEFEDAYDKESMDSAPTDHAKRKYRDASARGSRASLMGAKQFQYEQQKIHNIRKNSEFYDNTAKKVLGADSDILRAQGTSGLQMSREGVAEGASRVIDGLSRGIYTKEEAEKLQLNGANTIANNYFNHALHNNLIAEGIVQLDAPVLATSEDLAGPAGESISKTFGVPDLEKIVTSQDGMTTYLFQKGNNKTVKQVDTETGETVIGRYADVQKIVFEEGLDIQGTYKDQPKMDKYITPADKKLLMGRFLKKIEAKKIEADKKLKFDVQNAISAYSAESSDPTSLRFRPGAPGHEGSDLVRMLSGKIWASDFNDVDKYKMAGALYGAIVEGDIKDATRWATPTERQSKLDNIDKSVDAIITEFGAQEMIVDDLDTAKLKRTIRDSLTGSMDRLNRDSISPSYVYNNDKRLDSKFEDFSKAYISGDIQKAKSLKSELEKEVGSRQDQLGLPKFAQSIYKPGFSSTVSNILNEFMDRKTGYVGAAGLSRELDKIQSIMGVDYLPFMESLKLDKKLNEGIAYAATFPADENGIKARTLFLDSLLNQDIIKENYTDTIKKGESNAKTPAVIKYEVRAKLSPLIATLSRGSTTSERESQIRHIVDGVSARAMKLGGDSAKAYKELIDSNFISYERDGVGHAIPIVDLQHEQVNEEQIKFISGHFSEFKNIPNKENIPWEKYAGGRELEGLDERMKMKVLKQRFDDGKLEVIPIHKNRHTSLVIRSNEGAVDPVFYKDGTFFNESYGDSAKVVAPLIKEKKDSFFGIPNFIFGE